MRNEEYLRVCSEGCLRKIEELTVNGYSVMVITGNARKTVLNIVAQDIQSSTQIRLYQKTEHIELRDVCANKYVVIATADSKVAQSSDRVDLMYDIDDDGVSYALRNGVAQAIVVTEKLSFNVIRDLAFRSQLGKVIVLDTCKAVYGERIAAVATITKQDDTILIERQY